MSNKLARYATPFAFLLACACSADKKESETPTTTPTPTPTVVDPVSPTSSDDPATQAEYSGLPAGAIIRVEVDAQGREIESSALMRLDAQGAVTDEGDSSQVERAFQGGAAPAAVAKDVDELDQDSSQASWQDWRGIGNYGQYQPRVYMRQGSGAYWNYASPSLSISGSYRYYYYRRPICNLFCSPIVPGGVPLPGPIGPGIPTNPQQNVDAVLAAAFARFGVVPLQDRDYLPTNPAQVELGRVLFFDKLLSGNNDTACATCHIAQLGTGDGFSIAPTLAARTGRVRNFTVQSLLPRNAPPLYNRGHISYTSMFWDSRVARDPRSGGFITPASNTLPVGLSSPLSAQALFPLLNKDEMLGCLGDNELANAGDNNFPGIWAGVLNRVMQVPQYRQLIAAAYPGIAPMQVSIAHIANALGAYQSAAFRSDQSPFDRYLRGDILALSPQQKAGAVYFYGKGNCAGCHAGPLQTDHLNHNIVLPQFGPGASGRPGDLADYGQGRFSRNRADNFKFRTPSLRNVTLSGPWGHNGAYNSLRAFVRHYTNPIAANRAWNIGQIVLPFPIQDPSLFAAHRSNYVRYALEAGNEVPPTYLNDAEIEAILAFLGALTDERFVGQIPGQGGFPLNVPSGLDLPLPTQWRLP